MNTCFCSDSPASGTYAVTLDWPVGWGDLDSFGHVNNAHYFRYFEHARIRYFETVGVLDHMQATGVGPILARTDCRFRRAVTYPDSIVLGARVASVSDDRFSMHYRVESERQGEVVAYGTGEIVMFNYERQTKAKVPAELLAAITRLESAGTVTG
ncbi:MAG: thioesterase family protein [Myxococcota bacterium]|nr:thioesterase family protein [Myxococcota bacterium]